MKTLSIAFLLTLALAGITACSKDEPEPAAPVAETCQLTRTRQGARADASSVISENLYNANRQLIRTNYYDIANGAIRGHKTFAYNAAGKLTEATDQNEAGDEEMKTAYEYSAQGQLIKSTFRNTYHTTITTLVSVPKYNTANQMTRLNIDNPDSGQPIDSYFLYEHFPSGNVSLRSYYVINNSGAAELNHTVHYTYDDKQNPDQSLSEEYFSKNNLTSYTYKNNTGTFLPSISFTRTYTYNSQGYPLEVTQSNNSDKTFYEYQCQ